MNRTDRVLHNPYTLCAAYTRPRIYRNARHFTSAKVGCDEQRDGRFKNFGYVIAYLI